MEQHTPAPRRGASQVLARPPGQLWLQCLLLLSFGLQSLGLQASANTCSLIITNDHLRYLQEVKDSLLLKACKVTFTFAEIPDQNKDSQHRACYVRRAMSWMRPIFTEQMQFKEQSLNYNRTESLDTMRQALHTENCFPRETNHDKQVCSRTFSVPPAEMLDMVFEVFKISQELLLNGTNISEVNCASLYEVCPGPKKHNAAITSGPAQCDCSCPSTKPTSSDATSFLLTATMASSASQGSKESTARKERTHSEYGQGVIGVTRTAQVSPGTARGSETPESLRTSTEDEDIGSTEAPGSGGAMPQRTSTEDGDIGSTEAPVSVSGGAMAQQTSTENVDIGSTEAPVSVSREAMTRWTSTENVDIGSTEAPVSVSGGAMAQQTSTEDGNIGSTEAPGSGGAMPQRTSTEDVDIGSTEAPVSGSGGAMPQRTSTEDGDIGSTEAPGSGGAMPQRTSTEDEDIGSTEAPVTYGHVTHVPNTPRISPSSDHVTILALGTEEAIMAAPNPGGKAHICIDHAPERPALSEHRKTNQKQENLEPKVFMYVLGVCIPALLLAVCGLLFFVLKSRILTRELQRLSGGTEHPEGRPLNRLPSEHLEWELEEV